jgi:hypothetical protein
MENEKKPGSLDLLRGRSTWYETDPWWYRIVITIIMVLFLIVMVWALKVWVLPTIMAGNLSGLKISDLIKIGKGRSP